MQGFSSLQKFWTLAIRGVVLTAIVAVTACNTMQGAGRDIERAGEEIQDAAK